MTITHVPPSTKSNFSMRLVKPCGPHHFSKSVLSEKALNSVARSVAKTRSFSMTSERFTSSTMVFLRTYIG
ncbi:hypothetical protein D3C71_475330 [compost metagenome]